MVMLIGAVISMPAKKYARSRAVKRGRSFVGRASAGWLP
jgi:hypothetical protein